MKLSHWCLENFMTNIIILFFIFLFSQITIAAPPNPPPLLISICGKTIMDASNDDRDHFAFPNGIVRFLVDEPDCWAIGTVREEIPACCSAKLRLTDFTFLNRGVNQIDINISSSTFSKRGNFGRLRNKGIIYAQDTSDDEATLTGIAGGATFGPLNDNKNTIAPGRYKFDEIETKPTPKATQLQMQLTLKTTAKWEQIRYPGSAVLQIAGEEKDLEEEDLLVRLVSFRATPYENNAQLMWKTGSEINNTGFRIWRGIENGNGGYTNITLLTELSSFQADCKEGESTTTV
jgi:hypothetical protein